jgi:hypothetical protein
MIVRCVDCVYSEQATIIRGAYAGTSALLCRRRAPSVNGQPLVDEGGGCGEGRAHPQPEPPQVESQMPWIAWSHLGLKNPRPPKQIHEQSLRWDGVLSAIRSDPGACFTRRSWNMLRWVQAGLDRTAAGFRLVAWTHDDIIATDWVQVSE